MILGISNNIHNSSAALVDDGEVIAAVDEERISRYKRDGRVPTGAVNAVINEHEPEDISKISVSGTIRWSVRRQLKSVIRSTVSSAEFSSQYAGSKEGVTTSPNRFTNLGIGLFKTLQQPDRFLAKVADSLLSDTPIEPPVLDKMEYVDHHRAHAAGAFFTSGFDEATVLTVDSAGDNLSSTVYHGDGASLSRIAANSTVDSIGRIWSRLPTVFGFKGARHAGKFMGLAAYADEPPEELRGLFRDMVSVDGMDIKNNWSRGMKGSNYEELVRDLRNRLEEYPAPQVARAFQDRTEEIISEFAEAAVSETGCGNVAVSGGVMANVKANQRIYELPSVNSIWVQQAMSDSGLSIGGAYHIGSRDHGWMGERLDSVALGQSYDDDTVTEALERYGQESFGKKRFPNLDDLAEKVAEHLASGDVVCLFRGRMEYGPRALGQRSILYQPTDPDAIDWLNKRLDRTEFMPFAPVTLKTAGDECYINYDAERCPAADHMTISLDCTEKMSERSPGVVHVDETARPQMIDENGDELYYKTLRSYYEKTDIPTLINTSFNMHGEPLVRTPEHALESWLRSNNEVLVLEDRLIRREGKQ